jgi:hypothetical protein
MVVGWSTVGVLSDEKKGVFVIGFIQRT